MPHDKLNNHLARDHKNVDSKSKHGEGKYSMYKIILKTYYKCKICRKCVLFTYGNIRKHVVRYHQMPLVEYKRQYMTTNDQVEKVEETQRKNIFSMKLENIKVEVEDEEEMKGNEEGEDKLPKNEEKLKEKQKSETNGEDNLKEKKTFAKKKYRKRDKETERTFSDDPEMMCRVKCLICSRKAENEFENIFSTK